jgi:Cu+-exporting ATPase
MKKNLKIEGMTCSNCAMTIEKAFKDKKDVDVKINVGANKGIFTYDESKYNLNDLARIVNDAGYKLLIEETLDDNKKVSAKMKKKMYLSILLSSPLIWAMFGHIAWFDWVYVPELFMNGIFQLAVASVVQFYIGKDFYVSAYKGVKNKVLGMDMLVVLGTTSAFVYSLYLLYYHLFVKPMMHEEYFFEISAVIITMVLIGNYIEHIAKEKTTDALVDLVNLAAKEARVIKGDTEVMIPAGEVKLGDLMIVYANEKVPTDGIVVGGSSNIDESSFTGESIPVKKEKGAKVIGATINISEKITIEATKVGRDTLLSKIIETVEEASAAKPPIQRIADKIAAYFVPIVVSIAILNFLIQYFGFSLEITEAIKRTIAIMVISCPCALGLATPTSILVGNGLAAKNHILYKGGEFFELANKIKIIAFDKTGTLTAGKPEVTDFVGNQEVLDLVYSIEKESTHPISLAVKAYGQTNDASYFEVTDFEVIKGKGLKAVVNNKNVMIGSIKMVTDIDYKKFEEDYNRLINEAKTTNFVIVDGVVEALYAVRDEIKDTSKAVIDEMIKRGLQPVMITGDNKVVAKVIADELGIKTFYAEVLPHEKANIVKELQTSGDIVAFVGDGINDAPALKVSDVGIAMGHGTDIAINSSDVTLMSYDLSLVIKAIDISKATLKNIYQNFFWAFSYNIVAIPMAALGYLSMIIAAAAMGFSSIMVVLNALRLKTTKLIEITSKTDVEDKEKKYATVVVSNMT